MAKGKKTEKVSDKEKILTYLQKSALDLRKQFKGLLETKFEENPDRLVLVFAKTIPSDIEAKFVSVMNFKVEVCKVEQSSEQILKENEDLKAWKERHPEAVATKATVDLGQEAINPNSRGGKEEALAAWKKRHSSVKIAK